jgi:hypothetical protein
MAHAERPLVLPPESEAKNVRQAEKIKKDNNGPHLNSNPRLTLKSVFLIIVSERS